MSKVGTNTRKGTVLITGANGGLGVAMVRKILSRPELATSYHGIYSVIDASSVSRLESAYNLDKAHPSVNLPLDLTRLDDVSSVAAHVNAQVSAGLIPTNRSHPFRRLKHYISELLMSNRF